MTQLLSILRPISIAGAMLSSYNVPEPATGADPDPAAYDPGTPYAKLGRCHVAAAHTIYESVQDDNLDHDPVADIANVWWTPVGPTNRYRMFDRSVTSQTTRTGGIDLTLTVGQVIAGAAAFNVANVKAIQLVMTDPVAGVVYDKETAMQEPPTEADYHAYCFDPIVNADTFLATDLPSYKSATLRVIVKTATPTDVAAVGVLAVGPIRQFGIGVNAGLKLGIQDFSRKERNAWGDYDVVERAFARRNNFDMMVPRKQVDGLYKFMSSVRAVPCIWIVSDYYKSTAVYGFYKDFDITISYYNLSAFSTSIEGLT